MRKEFIKIQPISDLFYNLSEYAIYNNPGSSRKIREFEIPSRKIYDKLITVTLKLGLSISTCRSRICVN